MAAVSAYLCTRLYNDDDDNDYDDRVVDNQNADQK